VKLLSPSGFARAFRRSLRHSPIRGLRGATVSPSGFARAFRRSLRHSPIRGLRGATALALWLARTFPALATPFTLLLAQRPQGQLPGRPVLLRFLVIRVLAAAVAELRELETAGGRLLVLRRRVIPLLANGALQCDDFAHLFIIPSNLRFCLIRSANRCRVYIPIAAEIDVSDLPAANESTAPNLPILLSRQRAKRFAADLRQQAPILLSLLQRSKRLPPGPQASRSSYHPTLRKTDINNSSDLLLCAPRAILEQLIN
jgi:hypothetical protein